MPPIPSPLAILCFFRGIFWSLSLWKPVRGHRFVEVDQVAGQPSCVHVLECRDCGIVSVGWQTCGLCESRGTGPAPDSPDRAR